MLVADFTKVAPATLEYLMGIIDTWCSFKQVDLDTRVTFARQDQEPLLKSSHFRRAQGFVIRAIDEFNFERVANEIAPVEVVRFLTEQKFPTEPIIVASYSGNLLRSVPTLSLQSSATPISFSAMKQDVRAQQGGLIGSHPYTGLSNPPRFSQSQIDLNVPSVSEALEAVKKLVNLGIFDSPLDRALLRPQLAFVDSRFRTKVDGQIGEIVAMALSQGILEQVVVGSSLRLQRPEIQRSSSGITSPSSTNIPHLVQDVVEIPPDDVEVNADTQSIPSPGLPLTQFGDTPASMKANIYEYLKCNDLGPFKRQRKIMFDAIGDEVSRNPNGIAVPQLITSVIINVRSKLSSCDAVESLGMEEKPKDFPWRYVRPFLINIMVESGILVDQDGNKLEVSQRGGYSPGRPSMVAGLVKDRDWRLACEAVIVKGLCRAPFQIGFGDLDDVAYVLYEDPYGEDRLLLDEAINYLREDGQVEWDVDGVLRIAQGTDAAANVVLSDGEAKQLESCEDSAADFHVS